MPRLAGKTDLIPNHPNSMWVDPHETGLFLGQCAQYCGTQHAMMLLRVYVDSRADFDQWIQQQSQPAAVDESSSEGRKIFEQTACVNCHTIAGTPAHGTYGPDLTHLMSRQTIAAGATSNTPANLISWIYNPAGLKPGCKMPSMGLSLREAGCNRCIHGNASLDGLERESLGGFAEMMPPESITLAARTDAAPPRPLTESLHQWVTTVDHKRLGILYILYALVFLAFGGVEATIMRIQLIRPHNDFVSPQVFNRMFTMHGTTMIFFVAMPVLFGFANYLIPLMIGARDMAYPRLNAFSFWMTAFGGVLLYFSFLGGDGLYGAGNALRTWDGSAYAPLTSQTFSRGHSTDFWILSLFVSGVGSIGTAINIIATVLCSRCRGMTLGKMPLFAWMNIVMAALVILAVSPLTAAQLMLLVDRYLGGHFFDTQAGGSAVLWMHFFWIFGHPEVYLLVLPAFAFASEIIPVFSRKAIFGYPVMVAATVCIGFISMSVWAHHMFTVGMSSSANTFFVLSTMAIAVPTGIKIFNWLATLWGEQLLLQDTDAVLPCLSVSVFDRGPDGDHVRRRTVQLAAGEFLLRRCALSLCDRGCHSLHALRSLLLLVPQDVRKNVQRKAGPTSLLAFPDRLPSDVRFYAYSRHSRDASPHLYLRAGPRLGHLESHCDDRCVLSGSRCFGFAWQPGLVLVPR